ncbi:major facilitator superfamily protein [Aspergillus niger]|nr:major facilitator superfamily protein [Aspergillus niger]
MEVETGFAVGVDEDADGHFGWGGFIHLGGLATDYCMHCLGSTRQDISVGKAFYIIGADDVGRRRVAHRSGPSPPPDNGAHGGHPPSSVYSWWGPDESSWLLLADPNDISLDPTEQLKRQDFLLEYGHYAGRVWDCLVKASVALRLQITLSVVQFRDKLTQGESNDSSSGRQYWIRLLERCVEYLREQGLDIDLDMAKLAILVYSKRDLLCRARIGDVPASTSAALRREIEQANNHLPEVLSRDQSRSYSTRQRIRAFYGSPQDMKYSRLGAESAPVLPEPDCRHLPRDAQRRAFQNRVFADRVDATFQTINERIPVTFRPIRCVPLDRWTEERIDGKPADAPSSTVAFGNVEDACIYQDMCRDLDHTLGKNRGMGRKALQEARKVVRRARANVE